MLLQEERAPRRVAGLSPMGRNREEMSKPRASFLNFRGKHLQHTHDTNIKVLDATDKSHRERLKTCAGSSYLLPNMKSLVLVLSSNDSLLDSISATNSGPHFWTGGR